LDLTCMELAQIDIDLSAAENGQPFYGKAHFHHLLRIERRRTDRSKKPFLLMLLDISSLIAKLPLEEILEKHKD